MINNLSEFDILSYFQFTYEPVNIVDIKLLIDNSAIISGDNLIESSW
jgi:hypothetical protein